MTGSNRSVWCVTMTFRDQCLAMGTRGQQGYGDDRYLATVYWRQGLPLPELREYKFGIILSL